MPKKKRWWFKVKNCAHCGGEYETDKASQQYCSKSCGALARHIRGESTIIPNAGRGKQVVKPNTDWWKTFGVKHAT